MSVATQALKQTQASAEIANHAKSEFLSNMSHPAQSAERHPRLRATDGLRGSAPPTASRQASIDQILKGGWHPREFINEVL